MTNRGSLALLPEQALIAIVGGGLMGRLLALELSRAGHAVALYDRGGPQAEHAAARVAAAMLAPLAESAVTEPCVVRMGHYALTRWPELLAQLSQPVYLQREGTMVVWHRQDAAEAQRFRGMLERTQAAIPELPPLQALDRSGLAQTEPALAERFFQGYYLPGEGQLDNRQLLQALADTLAARGVQLHWNTEREIADFRPGTPGQPDWVIDCRGLGARPQWPGLRGVRGEVLRVHAPEVPLSRPTRLMHPRYPIYIAPKENHYFVIGATEIESDDMSPASVRSAMELMSAAYTVHSGFAEARILEINVQCRPALPDNLPAVRQVQPRVLEVNGLYRHGFMIAPAMLDATLELLTQGHSPLAARLGLSAPEQIPH
ncbi:MAG: glycine oxidase ThiO [Comamonas sp.]